MSSPRTVREAIISEMLGDLDKILDRCEAFPTALTVFDEKLKGTAAVLESAGDQYRMAVTTFNEQAKADLLEYFNLKTALLSEVASKTVEDQRAAIQEAARRAFRSEASDKAASLGQALSEAAKEFRRSAWTRLLEHAVTALVASSFTAGLVYVILK